MRSASLFALFKNYWRRRKEGGSSRCCLCDARAVLRIAITHKDPDSRKKRRHHDEKRRAP